MDFLKNIFSDKALTYSDLETALKDSKEIKLANLAGGEYVSKDKFTVLETERDGLKTQLSEAGKTIEEFKGMDIEGIKKASDEWKAKAEKADTDAKAQIAKIQYDSAAEKFIDTLKPKDPLSRKAILSEFASKEFKLDGDTFQGAKEWADTFKTENAAHFADETPQPQFTKGGTGSGTPGGSMADARAVMGLPPETK